MDGSSVREAANAEEGLAALEAEPPDLILLDVLMPGMSGYEMLQAVQDRHGVGTIPVIMFSGEAGESPKRAAERGAQAFLGKPLDPQMLIESTKQLIRASRA
jgi:twitching motility two-component system response regulator PilH